MFKLTTVLLSTLFYVGVLETPVCAINLNKKNCFGSIFIENKNLDFKKIDFTKCKNLEFVSISDSNFGNSIGDLKLPNSVMEVELDSNNFNGPLSGLKLPDSVEEFSLEHGFNFDNIKTLDGFKLPASLKILHIRATQIFNINAVSFPDTLEYLDFSVNSISDIDNINFPASLSELDLSSNQITNLSNATFNEGLKTLDLSSNPIEDFTNIPCPSTLEDLDLSRTLDSNNRSVGTQIIDPDLNLPASIKTLRASGTALGCTPIIDLPDNCQLNELNLPDTIEKLELNENFICELRNFDYPSELKSISLKNQRSDLLCDGLHDVSLLELPDTLEELDLSGNSLTISAAKPLNLPRDLKILKLNSVGLHSTDHLPHITFPGNLEELYLDGNFRLRTIAAIPLGDKLRILSLQNSELKKNNFDGVVFPDSIETVKLRGNKFSKEAKKKLRKKYPKVKFVF